MVAIVSRAAWGARTQVPNRPIAARARFVVFHWPGGTVGNDGAAVTRAIETQHRNQGWSVAPGYGYLIARDGRIFEGAGTMQGIHSPPRNADGIGVQFMVNLNENPTQAQRNSGRALYLWLNQRAGRTHRGGMAGTGRPPARPPRHRLGPRRDACRRSASATPAGAVTKRNEASHARCLRH